MNFDKEKLKSLMEEGDNTPISQADVEALSSLLTTLEKQDTEFQLSTDFSEKVVQRVMHKQAKENRFGWFGYLAGIVGLIVMLMISLSLVEFKFDFGFLKGIANYSGLFLFGIAFIILLNILEKKIIRFSSE